MKITLTLDDGSVKEFVEAPVPTQEEIQEKVEAVLAEPVEVTAEVVPEASAGTPAE